MLSKKLSPCLVLFAVLLACSAYADGIIIPVRPISKRIPPPLSIKYHHVDVTINNQVARTEVDQVFKNNFGSELEGIYIFPIPPGAAINDFSMYVGGEKIDARLLDKESALRVYEDIVRRQKDPALLEYAGRDMFKARVYPIPAYGEKRVGLVYTELIRKDTNLCPYRYSLNTEKFSADPLNDVRVKVTITSRVPILSIYSPTHQIQIERSGPTKAVVTYIEKNVKPDKDFVIYYRLSKEQMGVSLLSYKEWRGDGYFLLLVSPNDWSIDQKVLPKDVVFVFDRSGSMSGKKIEQAKSSLAFCLNALNEKDRFALITFNDVVKEFSTTLLRASRKNVENAKEFVKGLSASGGTDIHGALMSGLDILESGSRPKMLLFLTDGLPTVGITDVNEIVRRVAERNSKGARAFTFGVGYDVNTRLLDRLANESKGSSEYVRPNEDIEVKVSSLYSKIMNPVLTDIEIHYGSAGVSDVYPREIPDLFKGSQLVLTGRYRNSGNARIVLEGKMEGKTKRFSYTLAFERKDKENDFIPLLWASRRIGHLIEEIKAHGKSEELVEEIVRLSKRFGILTEYTSFLVDKDVTVALPSLREEAERKLEAADEAVGGWAVNQSVNAKRMKKSAQVPANTYYDDRGVERKFENVAQVGNRAFFNQNGKWVETTGDSKMPVVKVKRFSKAYFQLLRNDPSVGSYLALGQNVQFNIGNQQIQIADSGKEEFTQSELTELFD
ncbi:VWA domain-containing protein [candidate division TA06 bacterium]|uniref:VWA domain-containing protein n=1 Tax=candidate division TA06 bacterium TaxID=2250710 RepID=A0A523XI69_UNCT6|nr:MAG: VWA domain-containing protein [candidate division TA06 bacterium]